MQADASVSSRAHLGRDADLLRTRRQRYALEDMREGLGFYRLAFMLGWFDIKLRYRGSILGPFWLTLSTAIMILSMGVLYSELFNIDVREYLPYLALSLVLWNALSSLVGEACNCFTSAEGTIRAIRMPFTVYAIRTLVRNLMVFAHNAVVIVLVFLYFQDWPGFTGLIAIPGLALWLVDAIAICLMLGAFCARFRDVPPIVSSILQVAFFMTPIIWQPQALGAKIVYLVVNPFYPLLAIVRDPLLNHPPGGLIWTTAIGWSVLLWAVSWSVFARVRGRVAFWV